MLRKRQFSSFDVAAVVRELHESIIDSHVRNIYQLNGKTLLFKLRGRDGSVFWLVLEAGMRLHLTSYSRKKPRIPPAFCMALRKYLRNCLLIDVEQYRFERVVVFTFKTWAGELRLYLELFGDGNAILVDEEQKILHAMSYKRMRDRNILRGEDFRFAPPHGKDPSKVSKEELLKKLEDFGDVGIVIALTRWLGVGGFYAEEALLRARVDKKTVCKDLNDSMVDAVFRKLQSLFSQITNGELEPCVVMDENDGFIDVMPVKLKRYNGFNYHCYKSFNEALDEFYVRIVVIEKALATTASEVEKLRREAERLERIVKSQKEASAEAEAKAERNKRIGDVIYSQSGKLQMLLQKFLDGKKSGKKWSMVVSRISSEKKAGKTPSMLFESFDANHLVVNVCIDDLRFGLSLRKSVFDNAARFYEQYKRANRKLKGAKAASEESCKQLQRTKAKIAKAEATGRIKPAEVVEETAERKIRRKNWFEKFRWFVSSDGFLVVAGKDAVSNEVLVTKYAEEEDLVIHADVVGAPFVVVKTEGKKTSEECLQEAGVFAASFSRGWREGFASVDVYWVNPAQLSKSAPSGEYVPHGGFLVLGRRNWMRGTPLKLAIGVARENGEVRFVGGPIDAVKAKTSSYVVIVPGDSKGKVLFKHVLKVLAGKTPKRLREKVAKASFEKIRQFVPYNKGRVLEK